MDFLTSIAVICIFALALSVLLSRLRLPPLLGMLIVGIVLGPYALNLIAPELLGISPDLRQLALVIILLRAGLNLNLEELKKNGVTAVLLCFLPATAEIAGYLLFGTLLLDLTLTEASVLGCVMAAVSPAVVVPRMLKCKETGYGVEKGIPDTIMAGASADDVFVIVLFMALTSAAAAGTGISAQIAWQIPTSIVLGILFGAGVGAAFAAFVKKVHIRDSFKVIVMLCISCLFLGLQNYVEGAVPYSGLLSVISFGATMFALHKQCAKRLSGKFSKLWLFAEILLFALVGAEVDVSFALQNSGRIVAVLFSALFFRMAGTFFCTLFSSFRMKERIFVCIAYIPKATVQAAIGAIPLSMGLACGQTVLSAAVLAILITAPLGAFLTDLFYKRLLIKAELPAENEGRADPPLRSEQGKPDSSCGGR